MLRRRRAVGAALARLRVAAAAAVLVDLRLSGIQQCEQARIVRIVGAVDDGVLQVRRGDRRADGKVGRVAGEERDRIGAVLQQAGRAGIEDQVDAGNARVAKREVATRIGLEAVEIERRIRQVVAMPL